MQSEQTVVAHACLGHRMMSAFAGSSVRDRREGGGDEGGPPVLAGTGEYQ